MAGDRFILYQADFIDWVDRFTGIECLLNPGLIEEFSQNAGYSIAEKETVVLFPSPRDNTDSMRSS